MIELQNNQLNSISGGTGIGFLFGVASGAAESESYARYVLNYCLFGLVGGGAAGIAVGTAGLVPIGVAGGFTMMEIAGLGGLCGAVMARIEIGAGYLVGNALV